MAKIYDSQSREEAIKLCKPADESSNSQAVLLPPRQALAQAGVRFYTSSSYTSSTYICETHHLHFENLCPALSSTCPRAGSPRPLRTTTLHTFCYVVTSEWQCSDPPGHSLQVAVCGAAVLCFEGRRVRRVGLPGGEARGAGGTSGGSPPRSLARSSEPSSSNQPSIP